MNQDTTPEPALPDFAQGEHRPTPEGLHCMRDGFAWPCRGTLRIEVATLTTALETAQQRIELLERNLVKIEQEAAEGNRTGRRAAACQTVMLMAQGLLRDRLPPGPVEVIIKQYEQLTRSTEQAMALAERERDEARGVTWEHYRKACEAANILRAKLTLAIKVGRGLIDLFTFDDNEAVSLHPQYPFHLKIARRQLDELTDDTVATPDPVLEERAARLETSLRVEETIVVHDQAETQDNTKVWWVQCTRCWRHAANRQQLRHNQDCPFAILNPPDPKDTQR